MWRRALFVLFLTLAGCRKEASSADAGRADPGPPVAQVLSRVAERFSTQRTAECAWTETTVVQQLGADGGVAAQETAVFEVTPRAGAPHRTRTSLSRDVGELPARMSPQSDDDSPKDELERRRRLRPPFEPAEQPKYSFRVRAVEGPRATVTFLPREAELGRGVGVGVVDLETGRLVSLKSSPSKLLPFLKDAELLTTYAETPCGDQPAEASLRADGSFFGNDFHVRTQTRLSGFRLVTPDAGATAGTARP